MRSRRTQRIRMLTTMIGAVAVAASALGSVGAAVPAFAAGGATRSAAVARPPASIAIPWRVTLPGTVNRPALWRDRVVATAGNTTTALGLRRANLVWQVTHPDESGLQLAVGVPTRIGDTIDAPIFTPAGSGSVAYDARTGAFSLSGPGFHTLRGTLVADGGATALVTGGYGSGVGPLYLLQFTGGPWFVNFGAIGVTDPVISGGRAFVGTGGSVLAFDAAQGCAPLPIPSPPPYCAPTWNRAVAGTAMQPSFGGTGRIVASDNAGVVSAFDAATGTPAWATPNFGTALAPTRWGNGLIYVGGADGVLRVLDAATGAPRWTGDAGAAIRTAVALDNGKVYVLTDGGRLVTFPAAGCGAPTCAATGTGDAQITGARAAGAPRVRDGIVVTAFGNEVVAFAA